MRRGSVDERRLGHTGIRVGTLDRHPALVAQPQRHPGPIEASAGEELVRRLGVVLPPARPTVVAPSAISAAMRSTAAAEHSSGRGVDNDVHRRTLGPAGCAESRGGTGVCAADRRRQRRAVKAPSVNTWREP